MALNLQNLSGQLLGQYELHELLGIGGMGAVYRARQQALERDVAVKVLNPALSNSKELLARFNREAKTYASLEHPHIVPVYDYGTQDGISYVVMRLLTGGTLEERIEHSLETKRPLASLEETAKILRQLGSALDYAHSRGVIHRDIKTSNVMFDDHGTAFLVDFGIAKLMNATALTGTGMAMGTPSYMAPEQWRGDEVTPAADQYSLGVLAFITLTTRLPFEADTPFALMNKHLNEEPTPVTLFRDDLPDEVKDVLTRTLEKDPTLRYPTVLDFVNAFDQAIQDKSGQPTGFFVTPLPVKAIPAPHQPMIDSQSATPPRYNNTFQTKILPRPSFMVIGVVALMVLVIGGVMLALLVTNMNNERIAATENAGNTQVAVAAAITETEEAINTQAAVAAATDTAIVTALPSETHTPTVTSTRQPTLTRTATDTATPDVPVLQTRRNLILRAGPGSEYPNIAEVQADELLEILGISEDGGWYFVLLPDGSRAWIVSSGVMVSVEGPVDELEIAASPTPLPTATPTITDTPTASDVPSATPIIPTLTPIMTSTSIVPTLFQPVTPFSATATPIITRTILPTSTDIASTGQFVCEDVPPPRLQVGQAGIVLDDDERPLNVRNRPGLGTIRVDQLLIRETFMVLDGPVCSDGYAWFEIDYGGLTGWIAEGDNLAYFVAPIEPETLPYAHLQPGCEVVIEDDFLNDESGNDWFEGTGIGTVIRIQEEAYQVVIEEMEISPGGEAVSWGSLRGIQLFNASHEAVVHASHFSEDDPARTGLWIRYQDEENFLAFMIRGDGAYRIARLEDGEYTDLIGWRQTDTLNLGDNVQNTLRVDILGDNYTFYINGQIVERLEENTWTTGRVAFWGAYEQTPITFSLDYFRVCER